MADNKENRIPNVPPLRFPGFSEEWERKRFRDVCNITTGNKNTQDKSDDGIYPFYVRSQIVERINSWTFDGEAILTAGDGVGVGKVFHYSTGKIGVHQRVYILSDFKCDGKYLYSYFAGHFYNRVKRMSAKNSVDSVRMEMIADMPISLPSTEEQKKIGHLLALLDERIATQNKIIEDLKKLKSAIRKKVFVSLKEEHTESLEINQLLTYEQPTAYIVTNDEYSTDTTLIPVLTANKGFVLGYTDEDFSIYQKGECIIFDDFTMDAKYVSFPFKVKSSAIKILTAKPNVNLRFMFEYLSYLELKSEEHKRHYISEIASLVVELPSKEMQNKIASLMTSLDNKLALEENTKVKYEDEKQYQLSQMFI